MQVSHRPCPSPSSILGPDGQPLCHDTPRTTGEKSRLILPDAPGFKKAVEGLAAREGDTGFLATIAQKLDATRWLSAILHGEPGALRFERDQDRAKFLTLVTTTAAVGDSLQGFMEALLAADRFSEPGIITQGEARFFFECVERHDVARRGLSGLREIIEANRDGAAALDGVETGRDPRAHFADPGDANRFLFYALTTATSSQALLSLVEALRRAGDAADEGGSISRATAAMFFDELERYRREPKAGNDYEGFAEHAFMAVRGATLLEGLIRNTSQNLRFEDPEDRARVLAIATSITRDAKQLYQLFRALDTVDRLETPGVVSRKEAAILFARIDEEREATAATQAPVDLGQVAEWLVHQYGGAILLGEILTEKPGAPRFERDEDRQRFAAIATATLHTSEAIFNLVRGLREADVFAEPGRITTDEARFFFEQVEAGLAAGDTAFASLPQRVQNEVGLARELYHIEQGTEGSLRFERQGDLQRFLELALTRAASSAQPRHLLDALYEAEGLTPDGRVSPREARLLFDEAAALTSAGEGLERLPLRVKKAVQRIKRPALSPRERALLR